MNDKFKCTTCGQTYPWLLQGGTNKMIGNPVEYSIKFVKDCCYCVGHYPDGTNCPGGKKI